MTNAKVGQLFHLDLFFIDSNIRNQLQISYRRASWIKTTFSLILSVIFAQLPRNQTFKFDLREM